MEQYDTVTGIKTGLVKVNGFDNDLAISSAIMSGNGQWITFKAEIDGHFAIQAVRADGKELQTLYCTATAAGGPVSWSPDLHYIVFNESDSNFVTRMRVLDTTNGQLHTLITPFNKQDQGMSVLGWASNSSFYLRYEPAAGGITCNFHSLYLVRDVTKDTSQQQANLQQIPLPTDNLQPSPTAGPAQRWGSDTHCHDFTLSPDTTQLLLNDYMAAPLPAATPPAPIAPNGPSALGLRPTDGTTITPVYSDQSHDLLDAQFITNSTICYHVQNDTTPQDQNGFWTMDTDGTNRVRFWVEQPGASIHSAALVFSADKKQFALTFYGDQPNKTTQSLIFGSLNGGNPITIDTAANHTMFALVGWATV